MRTARQAKSGTPSQRSGGLGKMDAEVREVGILSNSHCSLYLRTRDCIWEK